MSSATSGIHAHTGLVRMDELEAPATWDGGGGDSLVLKFDSKSLTPGQLEQLALFRVTGRSVLMRFPGCDERTAIIVGFGAKDNAFYLTWV
ncbi:hypothetical protein NA78x_004875 [Anatilimnocola sp. NA78]|uniref:hypothetical protein n=1 Tax=Anatilimnocola sp. NA78 TaxID=3415683 RepID=UPI003CE59E3A